MLSVVDVTRADPGHPTSGTVDAGTAVDRHPGVDPVEYVRADHRGARVQQGVGQQPLQRVGSRHRINGQQPQETLDWHRARNRESLGNHGAVAAPRRNSDH